MTNTTTTAPAQEQPAIDLNTPWTVRHDDDDYWCVVNSLGVVLFARTGVDAEAVARVIAAAPKLLEIIHATAELRRRWRSQDESEAIDSIAYMDGLDELDLDGAIAEAASVADWTERDDNAALQEGWVISWALGVSGENGEEYRLERVDAMAVFVDDAAAWAHVVKKAESGSELHQRALAFIEHHNPTEYSHIAKATGRAG
jgi:hypothetical protein